MPLFNGLLLKVGGLSYGGFVPADTKVNKKQRKKKKKWLPVCYHRKKVLKLYVVTV